MAKKKKTNKPGGGAQHLSPEKYLLSGAARNLEKGKCYISSDLVECGEGMVIVSRLHNGGRVSLAAYLVDSYCLGVKNTYFNLRLEPYEFEDHIHNINADLELREITYEEAHNWVWGSVAWAEKAGIKPHKDFAITKMMLDQADACATMDLEFGRNGEHFLVVNTMQELDHYLPTLRDHLGEDFDYTVNTDPFGN
ncbi:MAG: hypothetical protein IKR25_08050 [Muribaculaceae bacterium]|nr:hypothetical protein [Muribaculaceae bacterium]